MQKWEYVLRSNLSESDLDYFGEEGWELVAVAASGGDNQNNKNDNTFEANTIYFYFKRPKS